MFEDMKISRNSGAISMYVDVFSARAYLIAGWKKSPLSVLITYTNGDKKCHWLHLELLEAP